MNTNKKVSPSIIVTAAAAVVMLVGMCWNGFLIGDEFSFFRYDFELGEMMWVFFQYMNDYIIYLALAAGVVLCTRTSRALPIALITYLAYAALVIVGRFVILWDESDSDYVGLVCVAVAIAAAVIWTVNPRKFRWAALMFVPYTVYLILGYLERTGGDVYWDVLVSYIGETLLFAGIILKCTVPGEEKQLLERDAYYWLPVSAVILIQSIAYLVIMTA